MILAVISQPKGGKTEVAGALATVVLAVRQELAGAKRKRLRSGKAVPILSISKDRSMLGLATERTSGVPLAAWGLDVRRTLTLSGVGAAIASAPGGVVVLDTATQPYERALESFRDQSNRWRLESEQGPAARMTPEAWGIINRRYRQMTAELADRVRADLIEVHRQGAQYQVDPDYGPMESEGLRARGWSESGSRADLLLRVHGGLKSNRDHLEIEAYGDPSGHVKREPIRLPRFGAKGREELAELLYGWLAPALRVLIPASDEDREHWNAVLAGEAPDAWPEAKELSDRGEAKRLADHIEFMWIAAELAGQKDTQKRERARLLYECFSVTDGELLPTLPVARLREGVADLERRLRDRSFTDDPEVATRLLLDRVDFALLTAGLAGQKDTQKEERARVLHSCFGVMSRDLLASLPAEALRAGVVDLERVLRDRTSEAA